MAPRKKMRKRSGWSPPPEFLAPVDPEEFKFCFFLMEAAGSGRMATPNPNQSKVSFEDTVYAFTDLPFNRAMLAVSKHFKETRGGDPETRFPAFAAMCHRLMALTDLIRDCLEKKERRFEKFIQEAQSRGIEIQEAFIEAGASAEMGKKGFKRNSILQIADKLLAAEHAVENARVNTDAEV
jgi:hypothetical protein